MIRFGFSEEEIREVLIRNDEYLRLVSTESESGKIAIQLEVGFIYLYRHSDGSFEAYIPSDLLFPENIKAEIIRIAKCIDHISNQEFCDS